MDPGRLHAALEALSELVRETRGDGAVLRRLVLQGEEEDGTQFAQKLDLLSQYQQIARKAIQAAQAAGQPSPTNFHQTVGQPDPPRHSPDFRSVYQDGQSYSLTKAQAEVVRVLWEARANRTPDVSDRVLLTASGTDQAKLSLVFRDSPSWGRLVCEGGSRGTHRLAAPGEQPGPQAVPEE